MKSPSFPAAAAWLALALATPVWAEEPARPSAALALEEVLAEPRPSSSLGGVEATLLQRGTGNLASIDQRRTVSAEAWIFQNGDQNVVTLSQAGAGNSARLFQVGSANTLDLTQNGDGNAAVLDQIGNGLALEVTQSGGAVITITQSGG